MASAPCPDPNSAPLHDAVGSPAAPHHLHTLKPHTLGRIYSRHARFAGHPHGHAAPMNTGFEHVPAEPSLPDEGCLRRVATVTKPSVGAPAAAAGLSGAKVLAMAGGFGVLAGGGALGYRGASGGSTPPWHDASCNDPAGRHHHSHSSGQHHAARRWRSGARTSQPWHSSSLRSSPSQPAGIATDRAATPPNPLAQSARISPRSGPRSCRRDSSRRNVRFPAALWATSR